MAFHSDLTGHDKTADELYRYFDVEETGLSDSQVESNRKKYGPNGELYPTLSLRVCGWKYLFSCQCQQNPCM